MKGQLILLRDFDGGPLVRRLWSSDADRVYVCMSDDYDRLVNQQPAPSPTGFPKENAFQFEEALVASLQDAFKKGDLNRVQRLWRRAVPFPFVPGNLGSSLLWKF